MLSMISGIEGRVVSVRVLLIACMIEKCCVAPWLTVPLSATNVWIKGVAYYSISILSFSLTQEYLKKDAPAFHRAAKLTC